MSNGPERQVILDKMIEIVRTDAPWLWGFHPVGFSLYHGWYHNAKANLMANNTLKYKRIESKIRQQSRIVWNQPVVLPIILLALVIFISAIPAWISYKRRERSSAL